MFEFMLKFLSETGYLGIFILMILENVIPPIPSELIMSLAGFAAARGDLNLVGVILAGTSGAVVGALPWYYVGKIFGKIRLKRLAARRGRWLTISAPDIDRVLSAFDKRGRSIILVGRLIQGIRTLISVPAGIAGMPMRPFLIYTAAGSFLWTGFLAVSGFILEGNYAQIGSFLEPISWSMVGLLVAAYFYRVVTYRSPPLEE